MDSLGSPYAGADPTRRAGTVAALGSPGVSCADGAGQPGRFGHTHPPKLGAPVGNQPQHDLAVAQPATVVVSDADTDADTDTDPDADSNPVVHSGPDPVVHCDSDPDPDPDIEDEDEIEADPVLGGALGHADLARRGGTLRAAPGLLSGSVNGAGGRVAEPAEPGGADVRPAGAQRAGGN